MASREEVLAIVDRAYEARCGGDKEAFAACLAPDARFTLFGMEHALAGFPAGETAAAAAVGQLIDRFTFHSRVCLDAIVEGNRAAVRSRVVVSTSGGDPVVTEVFDLWTIGADGRVESIVQFADTAHILRLLG